MIHLQNENKIPHVHNKIDHKTFIFRNDVEIESNHWQCQSHLTGVDRGCSHGKSNYPPSLMNQSEIRT